MPQFPEEIATSQLAYFTESVAGLGPEGSLLPHSTAPRGVGDFLQLKRKGEFFSGRGI